jgi:hypothetical protein
MDLEEVTFESNVCWDYMPLEHEYRFDSGWPISIGLWCNGNTR